MESLRETTISALTPDAFIRRLAAAVILINLFVFILAGLSLSHSRIQYDERAAVTTQNLARVLEEYIDGSFDKIDIILLETVNEIENRPMKGTVDRRELSRFLTRQLRLLPELYALWVLNDRGEIEYGAGPATGSPVNLADREYFVHLRDNANTGLFISKPLISRISGKWVVILARRINRPNGSFAGVVIGSVPLEQFLKLFSSIDSGKHGAISLRDGDLGVIVRYPEPGGLGSTIGQKKVSREFQELVARGRSSGTFKARPPIDNIERIYTFRKFAAYPLYVNVGRATDDYLAIWHGEVVKMTAASLLFFLITLFTSIVIYRDWKRKKAAVVELMQQEEKFRTIADYTYDWEFWLSPDDRFIHVSPSCKRITGYDAEAFYADSELMFRIVHPDDYGRCVDHRQAAKSGMKTDPLEMRMRHADGGYRWIEHVCQPIVNSSGEFIGTRGSNRDITERKRVEAEMEHMAYHDALTGLPNRLLLDDRLSQAIAHAGRCGHLAAILFFDLDNFKAVNDTHGHTMGDRLLKNVANRLMTHIRQSDTLARMGGDEFIIILTEVFEPEDAAHAARELLNSIAFPFVVDGHEFFITSSIGISLYPIDGIRKETLLKNADIAMFQAKKHGWNSFQFFTEEINSRTEKRLMIETDLRHAIVQGEFTLCYQPWINLARGSIGGMEALIRWAHPQHGLILPDQFIQIAEETGLIIQIGEWVIRNSCRFLKELHRYGLTGLTMSVNVSGKQLRSPDLIGTVELVLAELEMDPASLELELTESAVMENVEESSRYMDALKSIGVRLALDDFGTGYSSLNYLKRFPLDRLKIDRSFVRDCPANPDDVAIARAVIALARSLNLQVTAEGVETMEQADFFSREGCDVIQGHLVGKPMSENELRRIFMYKVQGLD